MAASGRHVGHYMQRNGRFLANNFEQLFGHRRFGWTPSLRQQATEAHEESTETIVIPRKKTWSKEAVLQALAATVSRDATAYKYQLQDDPYLAPKTFYELRLFSLSQESGKSAAKYFVNSNPKFFTKDFAEPHIPCLMPETVAPLLEEMSEEALKERISLRRVPEAVDMYDRLLQAGTPASIETTHDLLDLICIYCDKDPDQEMESQSEDNEVEETSKTTAGKRKVSIECTWKENNNAERIFDTLPEKDTRCYSALIRGMVKHGAHAKAFDLYNELLNNRLTGDIHMFNALISVAPSMIEKHIAQWGLIKDLLIQMKEQKIQPNLQTFNSVLKALRRCGRVAITFALTTMNEMKAIGISPSLATYYHLLLILNKDTMYGLRAVANLNQIITELSGNSFTCQDPEDVYFFSTAMKICYEHKDLQLAYKIQSLVEVGDNWMLLGDSQQQVWFYGSFFSLLCSMESVDKILTWYRKTVPSLYFPNSKAFSELLQALDTEGRLDLLPQIWKDVQSVGHDNKLELVEDMLKLMARDEHTPELQKSLAECALDIKRVFVGDQWKPGLNWSKSSLRCTASLLLRADMTQQAWEIMQLFKSKNRVPDEGLIKEFLSACLSSGSTQRAVDLVQLSAAFCLPGTARLAEQTLADFNLTDEQRAVLSELNCAAEV